MSNNIYYSEGVPKILEEKDRRRIANQILKVLSAELGSLNNLYCLDVGCSSGVIANELSKEFKRVVGIDVDKKAVELAKKMFKKKKLEFGIADGEELNFKSDTFDVVVCNQVYNFVDNPQKLIDEIHRVLKPGGVCFFSARNKLSIIEPQYKLPFLSILPSKIAEKYLQILKKGKVYFGKNYMYHMQLKKLVSKFSVTDYTTKILKDPEKYGFINLMRFKIIANILPLNQAIFVLPNFIWILKK